MNWPPHIPDGCPPPDAPDASGVVYRLVGSDGPSYDDLLPKVLEEPERDYQGMECLAAGLSVYRKRKDLSRLFSYPTFRNRTMLVAQAQLSPAHGKLKATPPKKIRNSHHTWWWPVGVDPVHVFTLADPESAGLP